MKCTEHTYRGRVVHIHSVTLHSVVVGVVAVSRDPVLVVFVVLSPCGLPHGASRTRQASGVAVQDPDHLQPALRARWNRTETRKPLVQSTGAELALRRYEKVNRMVIRDEYGEIAILVPQRIVK